MLANKLTEVLMSAHKVLTGVLMLVHKGLAEVWMLVHYEVRPMSADAAVLIEVSMLVLTLIHTSYSADRGSILVHKALTDGLMTAHKALIEVLMPVHEVPTEV